MNPVKVILASCSQQEVIRSLVKRYVAAMIRSAKTDEGLTEENFKVGAFSLGPVSCHSSELTSIKGRKSSSGFKEKLHSWTCKQAQMVDICSDLSIIPSIETDPRHIARSSSLLAIKRSSHQSSSYLKGADFSHFMIIRWISLPWLNSLSFNLFQSVLTADSTTIPQEPSLGFEAPSSSGCFNAEKTSGARWATCARRMCFRAHHR